MTRITSVVTLCVLAVVGVASAAPNEPAGKRAQLHVLDTKPLVVRGVGFKASERVRVLVRTGAELRAQTKVASRVGVVKATFAISFQPCDRFSVQAVGAKGSRVPALANVTVESHSRGPEPACTPAGFVDR